MRSEVTLRRADRIGWSGAVCAVAAAMLLVTGIAMAPAEAHRLDRVTPHRAGPIVRGDTIMRELRGWFGSPSGRKTIRVGCERVISAGWEGKLRVYATRATPRMVAAIFVRAPSITSAEHGELTMRTRKGLRIGNSEGRVRHVYPRAGLETHGGHTHYRLHTADDGPYMMAKVVDGEVVQLEVWPYEFR